VSYENYAYPPPPAPETDQKAVWALVSAIFGFILCPVVLHIVGWVLANQSLADIAASQGRLTGDGIAKAARIVSIVGLVLSALGVLFAILILVVGFAGFSASG
jgi:hypothetical protein